MTASSGKFSKCQYNKTVNGRCENQNFGKEYCYYHSNVVHGFIEPEDQVVMMRDLPSLAG